MSMTHPHPPRAFFPVLPIRVLVEAAAAQGRRGQRCLTDFRVAYAMGAELLWFVSAVIVGLMAAGWLAGLLAGDAAPMSPVIHIL
jgi:hypothetical protein